MSTVCIIPARGGSKRIPRKNIRDFCGKPMISWSIEAALASGVFDDVIVSTDDEEIAHISKLYGASVPFLRPPELSDDYAGLTDVLRHTITSLRSVGCGPDQIACIYATAAFLRPIDIQGAFKLLATKPDAEYVLAVTSYPAPVERALIQDQAGWLRFLWPDFAVSRSQDLHTAYHDAGLFFMGKAEPIMRYATTLAGNTIPYAVPRMLCQDIDTMEDWNQAATLFAFMRTYKSDGNA